MSNKFTITNPSYDKIYNAHAWQDNNRTLALVQGEGITIPSGTSANATVTVFRAKAPRFQLRDDRGVISLASGNPQVLWAVKRPNSSEDMVVCNVVSAADGIIEIPITASVTQYAGDVYGEIRVITSNGVIKFYGINASVGNGVSDDATAQSAQYSALLAALQKVVTLDASGIATLDTLIDGDLPDNGSNPVASGVLKTFLKSHYVRSESVSGDAIDTANDQKTIYIHNVGGGVRGLVFFVGYSNYTGATTVTQYRLCKGGRVEMRKGTVVTPYTVPNTYTWGKTYDEDWNPIGSTQNIQDAAVTTAKLADGNVTSAKIGAGEVKTTNIADSNVTPGKLDRTYSEYKSISSSELDSATTNGIVYKVSLDGRTNYMFCSDGNSIKTQYRFDTLGYAKCRVYQNGAWSDWNPIGSTQNIQDAAVTTAKLHDGSVTVSKLNIDDPDTLVQLLEGKTIYFHKSSNTAPVETMYTKYPIPTIWFTGSKYYLLSGRTTGTNSGSYNYTINKLPTDATIAGLSLHSSISKQQLKSALGYCEVRVETRVPSDNDSGAVGDKWVAQLSDGQGSMTYEVYELQRYYTDPSAPTVTRYGWERVIYASEASRVTVWDASTSASNNYTVPSTQAGKLGDFIVVTSGTGSGGAIWQLTKITSGYGSTSYLWEQPVFASNLSSVVTKVSTHTFSYTLTVAGWTNNTQTISVPQSYTLPGNDIMANISIDSATQTQLIADGCIGIYLSSEISNAALTVTAHAMGNTPTAAVDIRVILTPVNDISE